MNPLTRRAVLAGIGGAAVMATGLPAFAAETKATRVYGNGCKLDAYYDPAKSGQPWVIVVHGGSWMGGTKDSHPQAVAGWRAAGFVVFSIDYRLSTKAPWPAQRDDTYAAMGYVIDRAEEFGIDPNRGALYGVSAGGHIAISTAARQGRVRCAVGCSSVLQPLSIWQYAHGLNLPSGYVMNNTIRYLADWEVVLLQGPPKPEFPGVYARWQDATPQTHLSRQTIPFLEVHSEGDIAVPLKQAESFIYYANQNKPGRGTLIKAPGSTHDDSIIWGNTTRRNQVVNWVKARTA